jgi:hypothetical protein
MAMASALADLRSAFDVASRASALALALLAVALAVAPIYFSSKMATTTLVITIPATNVKEMKKGAASVCCPASYMIGRAIVDAQPSSVITCRARAGRETVRVMRGMAAVAQARMVGDSDGRERRSDAWQPRSDTLRALRAQAKRRGLTHLQRQPVGRLMSSRRAQSQSSPSHSP